MRGLYRIYIFYKHILSAFWGFFSDLCVSMHLIVQYDSSWDAINDVN